VERIPLVISDVRERDYEAGGLKRLSQEPAGKTVLTRNKHIVLALARGGGGGHEVPQKERERYRDRESMVYLSIYC
jgi:hypothetical protein